MSDRLPRSVAALLGRLTELTDGEQLLAYEAIRDYLAAGGKVIEHDEQLDARASAVRALRAVADHYEVGVSLLNTRRFDAAPEDVRGGWRSGRVIDAFETWRFAKETAAGRRTRPTARQRSLKSAAGAMRLRTDDYLAGVRVWLATDPPKLAARDYNAWSREHNKTLEDGALPYPGYHPIRSALGLSWKTVIRVARGEITLDRAQRSEVKRRSSQSSGPHDLVSSMDIVAMTGRAHSTIQTWMRRDTFPTPVLFDGDRRYWLREDIEAFASNKPFPKRELNELSGLYVNRNEAAKILGIVPETVDRMKGRPQPAYRGSNRLWLRSEIEAFRDERERNPVPRGRPSKR